MDILRGGGNTGPGPGLIRGRGRWIGVKSGDQERIVIVVVVVVSVDVNAGAALQRREKCLHDAGAEPPRQIVTVRFVAIRHRVAFKLRIPFPTFTSSWELPKLDFPDPDPDPDYFYFEAHNFS